MDIVKWDNGARAYNRSTIKVNRELYWVVNFQILGAVVAFVYKFDLSRSSYCHISVDLISSNKAF